MTQLIQRTPEWYNLRRNYIGASDSLAIMGVSPWKTSVDLWREKVQGNYPEIPNSSMQRGIDLEPEALRAFENLTGYLMTPKVVFHPTIPYLMASLDGIDIEGKAIVEIKCPGKVDHECAMDGEVPAKYIPQLMHQMETSGLKKVYYFSYNITSYKLLEVHFDQIYVENLLKEEREFWNCVLTKTEPTIKNKCQQMTSKEWTDVSAEYRDIDSQIKALEKRKSACKDRLFAISNGISSQGSGVTVAKITKKGTVDIEALSKNEKVDPEKYRKPDTEIWSVRVN